MNAAPKIAARPIPAVTLANVRRGRITSPERLLVYGMPKVGKSTFAAGAPSPIFIGADAGTEELDVARMPEAKTWPDLLGNIRAIATPEFDEFKTLVIDPVNWLEPIVWRGVCEARGWDGIESPGYGKGYSAAFDLWRELLAEVERVWLRGKRIILVAHATVKKFKNPEGEDYDRYQIAMHGDPMANGNPIPLFTGWVDAILFAREETTTKKDGKFGRAKGVSTGYRVLETAGCAAFEGGNRWSLPPQLPLGWSDFEAALAAARSQGDALIGEIRMLAKELELVDRAEQVIANAKGDQTKLTEAVNRLRARAEQKVKES